MPLNQIISPDRFIGAWEWGSTVLAIFYGLPGLSLFVAIITPSVFQEYALYIPFFLDRHAVLRAHIADNMSLSDNSLRNISSGILAYFSPIYTVIDRSLFPSLSLSILSTISSRNKLLEIPSFNLDAERGGKEPTRWLRENICIRGRK